MGNIGLFLLSVSECLPPLFLTSSQFPHTTLPWFMLAVSPDLPWTIISYTLLIYLLVCFRVFSVCKTFAASQWLGLAFSSECPSLLVNVLLPCSTHHQIQISIRTSHLVVYPCASITQKATPVDTKTKVAETEMLTRNRPVINAQDKQVKRMPCFDRTADLFPACAFAWS